MTFTTDAILNNSEPAKVQNRYFELTSPVPGMWEEIRDKQGDIINANIQTGIGLNRAGYLVPYDPVNNQWLALGYYQRPKIFTDSGAGYWNLDQDLTDIVYQSPSASNDGIAYVSGGDYEQSSQKLALVSYARHVIRVYDGSNSWNKLFDIGVAGSAGHVNDNKLWNPRACVWLTNGNLLLSSYNGYGPNATNHGHISEYDGNTGALVATRLEFTGDGQSAVGSNKIYRPMDIQIDPGDANILWCMEYSRNRVLKINTTTWLVTDIIYPPSGENFGQGWAFGVNSDYVFVLGNTASDLVIVNKSDGSLKQSLNASEFEHGGQGSYGNIRELEPDFIGIGDWGRNAIKRLYLPDTVDVPYSSVSPEANWAIGQVIGNQQTYDNTNNQAEYNTLKLDTVGDIAVLFERV